MTKLANELNKLPNGEGELRSANDDVAAGVRGTFQIISKKCVNSRWIARWMANDRQECCQCGVSCKIKINIKVNGHNIDYVVTQSEYNQFQKDLIEMYP